jgi:hypothetical protein
MMSFGFYVNNPDEIKDLDIQGIKDFIIGASRNINKKIAALEETYGVNIKLKPLPKKIPSVQDNSGMLVPVMGHTEIRTGVRGSLSYPTELDLTPLMALGPFLLDPIDGVSGENFKQRLQKIIEYIKIYEEAKTQLETNWTDPDKEYKPLMSSSDITFNKQVLIIPAKKTDEEKKKIMDQVNKIRQKYIKSSYIEFLPFDETDVAKINTWFNASEDDIKTYVKEEGYAKNRKLIPKDFFLTLTFDLTMITDTTPKTKLEGYFNQYKPIAEKVSKGFYATDDEIKKYKENLTNLVNTITADTTLDTPGLIKTAKDNLINMINKLKSKFP